jgi:hypothetical protein
MIQAPLSMDNAGVDLISGRATPVLFANRKLVYSSFRQGDAFE